MQPLHLLFTKEHFPVSHNSVILLTEPEQENNIKTFLSTVRSVGWLIHISGWKLIPETSIPSSLSCVSLHAHTPLSGESKCLIHLLARVFFTRARKV